MASAIVVTMNLVPEQCCVCGLWFAMDESFKAECRRRPREKLFYCPNGHNQYYTGKSDAQKLQEAQQELERERSRTRAAVWDKERAEKNAARLLKRAKAGVCPKCNRSFSALARHMETKHPERA